MSLSNHHIGNRVELTRQASHSGLKKEGREWWQEGGGRERRREVLQYSQSLITYNLNTVSSVSFLTSGTKFHVQKSLNLQMLLQSQSKV